MSRQRMIRPEFFTDEDLVELGPLTRLLFIGLWVEADRDGRLKDKPKSIKLAVLPADECNVDDMLDDLERIGSIRRYEVDGSKYIDIPGFSTYQHVHHREQQSTIPSCPKTHSFAGKPRANPGQASDKPVASTSTSTSTSTEKKSTSLVRQESDGFDSFWLVYPRKENRKKAVARWSKLSVEDRRLATGIATLMGDLSAKGLGPERSYIPLPTTFLNGERWEDWRDGPPANWCNVGGNGQRSAREASLQEAVARYKADHPEVE